jgi:hypothetical protein
MLAGPPGGTARRRRAAMASGALPGAYSEMLKL